MIRARSTSVGRALFAAAAVAFPLGSDADAPRELALDAPFAKASA